MHDFVYLAGPIAGTKQGVAFDWRHDAAAMFADRGVRTRSPLRAKESLAGADIGTDSRAYADRGWAYTPAGILTRDHNDCTTAAGVLVYMLGAERMTFGTAMEIAWAYDRHIPFVVVIEREGNIHDGHPMFTAAVKFRVESLEDGVDAMCVILGR